MEVQWEGSRTLRIVGLEGEQGSEGRCVSSLPCSKLPEVTDVLYDVSHLLWAFKEQRHKIKDLKML